MQILEKGITPNNINIQIEDWSKDYSFMPYGATIGTYPISKQSLQGSFSPKLGRSFRFQLVFKNHEQVQQAYKQLLSGEKVLNDFKEYHSGRKEDLQCI